MNDLVKLELEKVISAYFNGNRVYDGAYIWSSFHNLEQIYLYFHKNAHKRPLDADIVIDYMRAHKVKFKLYAIPSTEWNYNSLLDVVKTLYDYENEVMKTLNDAIDVCAQSEINDQETIDLINRLYSTQRLYCERATQFMQIVEAYGNTPRDWINLSSKIDDMIDDKFLDGIEV